ncbi:hypothetical protein F5883DRAFT_244203 [Diaporthe sp. PMI_573]|nr:hypothetical protein F5883DRAFT_244203 [Diaporthaceae sp. PMI_573]
MEFKNPKTGMFQQTELLRQTVKLWTLLIYQDTNPLRQDVNLASDDLTEKLLSELSRRFPDMNHDGSSKYGHEVFPKDGGAALGKGDDPETVCWIKNRVALQDEFARFVIWKSNFTSRDIALLLSDASPLYRSILETVYAVTTLGNNSTGTTARRIWRWRNPVALGGRCGPPRIFQVFQTWSM